MKCFSKNHWKETGREKSAIRQKGAAKQKCTVRQKSAGGQKCQARLWVCLAVMTAAAAAILLGGCGREPELVQKTDTAMGTIIQQKLYVQGSRQAAENVMELLKSLEEDVLSWRLSSSQIYRLNESAGEEGGAQVSAQLWDILKTVWNVSEKSGGALDVTLGDLTALWDIDSYASGEKEDAFVVPSKEEVERALYDTGYEKVLLDGGRIFLPEGMKLDLGAVGKGIACGEILDYLKTAQGVTGGVVSVGGSVVTFGGKPDGSAWKVGILDPEDTGRYLGFLSLSGEWCVSTSGDYERYVEVDGIRYHHILNPDNGYPARSGVRSVTILTRDGLLSDALSTACFVLGKEEGMKLAEAFGAEALFVDEDGKVDMTEGMKGYFQEE